MCSHTKVFIDQKTPVHAGFQAEIQDGLLITVINARDTCEITFLIVCFDSIYN